MIKLDHIRIAVKNYRASRDWYVRHLGLKVEFENSRRQVAALTDDSGLTLLLEQKGKEVQTLSCVLYFRVDNVDAKYAELLTTGVRFVHPPRKRFWGYGPEVKDLDGYRLRLWDEKTMNEKG
jgi:catechol 2,3-dioxygenase-like lactoylglutathione lyase family enzyme